MRLTPEIHAAAVRRAHELRDEAIRTAWARLRRWWRRGSGQVRAAVVASCHAGPAAAAPGTTGITPRR